MGRPVSDQEIGLPVRQTAQQRGDDRALRDYGIESCRLQTEIANRLLTGDPETVDTYQVHEDRM